MRLSYYKRPLFLLLLAYACGIFLFRGRLLKAEPPFPLPRAGVPAEGRVAEYPVYSRGRWRYTLKDVSFYGRPYARSVVAYVADPGGASLGDRVAFMGELSAPASAAAPGGLDWADFLVRRGVGAEARARELENLGGAGPLARLARAARARVLGAFEAGLPPASAAVMAGVVIGEKKGVPQDIRSAFQDSGAMHLLVASGSNVGFVVVVVYALCAPLRLRRRVAGAAALAAAGFYVLACGLDAPLVRAYLMFAAGLLSFIFRRETGAFHSLTLAAFAILLFYPRALFDAGFQMSFLAAYGLTVGMAAWGGPIGDLLRRGPGESGGRAAALAGWLAERLVGLLALSFFAQLGLYPLLAGYFHRVSAVSLLSNIVLVPASGAAMAFGFGLAALPAGWGLTAAFAKAVSLFMALFIGAVKFFASLPFSSLTLAEPSAAGVAGFYLLAFSLLHAPLLGLRSPRFYAPALAGLLVMGAGPLAAPLGAGGSGKALLFGAGDTACALLRAPGGGLFLVNPGLGGKDLAAAVLSEGSTALDGVLLTSLEEKNYKGLAGLAERLGPGRIYLPYGPLPPGLARALEGREVARLWPGEAAGAVKALWPGAAGYTGRGDVYDWEVAGARVREGGLCLSLSGGAPVCREPGEPSVKTLDFGAARPPEPGEG